MPKPAPRSLSHPGQRLRSVRESVGLTRPQLSAATGVSLRTIARVELEGRLPRVEKLQALAAALGVSVAELLGEERGAA